MSPREIVVDGHPLDSLLRSDRLPHIWCPGCGLGPAMACLTKSMEESGVPIETPVCVSGIGCTGRVAGYVQFDSFHTTHGRAIPFATGLKLANPELTVVVYSGDGDLIAIGGNHFIHAARPNLDLNIICFNNFIYGMTGGQVAPTPPVGAIATTSPYGCFERPFNLPYLAESSGAVYVARWTAFHVRHITRSMVEAFNKKGFSFIEIIAPCPTLYQRRNLLGDSLEAMRFYKQKSVIKNGANTKDVDLSFQGEIIVGKFVDIERPTLLQTMEQQLRRTLGARYAGWGGC